jgi:hypothetical protein
MHEPATVRRALDMLATGSSTAEVARRIGVSRAAVRSWRGRPPGSTLRPDDCPRCSDRTLDESAYAYVLGLYLGDGMLTIQPNGVAKLRIVQTAVYVDLIAEADLAIAAVIPRKVGHVRKTGCTEITSHSKHWICLFPQHGPGRKHERPIVLADWQAELVRRETEMFLRGLIHSDGCRSINTVRTGGKEYRYPRYFFSNASTDIMRLFTDACETIGVRWTRLGPRQVAVSRRADVALLDTFIGPKSLSVRSSRGGKGLPGGNLART